MKKSKTCSSVHPLSGAKCWAREGHENDDDFHWAMQATPNGLKRITWKDVTHA